MASSPPGHGPDQFDPMTRLYGSTHDQQGKLTCTHQMAAWLADLPDPTRRPQSLPAHEPCINKQENRQQSHFGVQTVQAPQKDLVTALPRHQHENPLRQHPISLMQPPAGLHIPRRQSSLKFKQRGSHQSLRISAPTSAQLGSPQTNTSHIQAVPPAKTATTRFDYNYPQNVNMRPQPADVIPSHAAVHQPVSQRFYTNLQPQADSQNVQDQTVAHGDTLVQNTSHSAELAVQDQSNRHSIQDVVTPGSQSCNPPVEFTHVTTVNRQVSEVRRMFGRDTANESKSKKRVRSDTPATTASLPPTKRVRGAIASARHRLSRVMTPAEDASAAEGRHSRLDQLTEAAKRMSLDAAPRMVRVVDFAPGVAKETVKIAVLGNTSVGKTKFIQAFCAGSSYEAEGAGPTLRQVADGYVVDSVNVVLDGVPVTLETWDVSSQCDEDHSYGNSVRPLLATFYDVVVICYDVSDESTLKAAETKGEAAGRKMVVEGFYEVSARTGEGVADFFESVVRFALQRRSRQSHGPVSHVKRAFKSLKRASSRK